MWTLELDRLPLCDFGQVAQSFCTSVLTFAKWEKITFLKDFGLSFVVWKIELTVASLYSGQRIAIEHLEMCLAHRGPTFALSQPEW